MGSHLPRIHVQNQGHQVAIELRPEGKGASQGGLRRGAMRAKAQSRSTANPPRSAWLMVGVGHGEIGTESLWVHQLFRPWEGVWIFFFFRVGLRLNKIEQKVQSSCIYSSPQTMSPVINILH